MKKSLVYLILLCCIPNVGFAQEPPVVVVEEDGTPEKEDRKSVVNFPEQESQFKGGPAALQKYISRHVRYPEEAIDLEVSGKVYLSFVVEKNGSITNIVVEKGVHPSLDNEAHRVVSGMPRWKPGKLKGRKVRTMVRLPIVFTLV